MAHYVIWICLCLTCIWGCSQTRYSKNVALSLKMLRLIGSIQCKAQERTLTVFFMVWLWMKACSWDEHRLSLLGGFSAVGYGFSMNTIAPWRPSDLEVNEYAIKRSSLVYHRLSLFDVTAAQGCHDIILMVKIHTVSHICLRKDGLWVNPVLVCITLNWLCFSDYAFSLHNDGTGFQ